eukprot:GHVS01001745.1.p1 GENE.GHVS01001745.1~~GHVS01001745.1.p1  ORF type:complete len:397 (+),score=55.06 GHVS01001745.1:183-1373(+)
MVKASFVAFLLVALVASSSAEVVEKLRGAKAEDDNASSHPEEAERNMLKAREALAELLEQGTLSDAEAVPGEEVVQGNAASVEASDMAEGNVDNVVRFEALEDDKARRLQSNYGPNLEGMHVHDTSEGPVVHKDHVRMNGMGRLVRSGEAHENNELIIDALVELISGGVKTETEEDRHREENRHREEDSHNEDRYTEKRSHSHSHRHEGGRSHSHSHIREDGHSHSHKDSHSSEGTETYSSEESSNSSDERRQSKTEDGEGKVDEVVITHIIISDDKARYSEENSEDGSTAGVESSLWRPVMPVDLDRACFECDVDYLGNDVKKIENGIESIKDCQKLCQEHAACDFFTFAASWGGCYLKHSRLGKKEDTKKVLISGMKHCNNHGSIVCHRQTIRW